LAYIRKGKTVSEDQRSRIKKVTLCPYDAPWGMLIGNNGRGKLH